LAQNWGRLGSGQWDGWSYYANQLGFDGVERFTVAGGSGADNLSSGSGDDRLSGHGGNDYLYGNDGDDQLEAGRGTTLSTAGAGPTGSSAGLARTISQAGPVRILSSTGRPQTPRRHRSTGSRGSNPAPTGSTYPGFGPVGELVGVTDSSSGTLYSLVTVATPTG
jgi:hypothetical protein